MSSSSAPTFLSPEEADALNTCDREPIHVPGAVQPHGLLCVLAPPSYEIVQVSANAEALTGHPPEALLGATLEKLVGAESAARASTRLAQDPLEPSNPLVFPVVFEGVGRRYEAVAHRMGPHVIIEFEPPSETPDAPDAHLSLQAAVERIQEARSLDRLKERAVEEVQRLTGFDRVKLYRFDEAWNGRVVAEARAEHMPSYLGLHFPSTDIPQQARALYVVNRTRLIADVQYVPAPLVAASATDGPLDMSHCALRSVSPIHLEYLRNMGVGASMSISIVLEGQLWGLLACHHATPRFLPYHTRAACALLGQVLALLLADQQEIEDRAYLARLKDLQGRLLQAMLRADTFAEGLFENDDNLLSLAGAQGVALYTADGLTTHGEVPSEEALTELTAWLAPKLDDDLYVTEALADDYPPAQDFLDVGSGLLALSLSRLKPSYLLWFRPELPRLVYWAGAPQKAVRVENDGTSRLHPRNSFETWKEVQRGRSAPWRPGELAAARALRGAIVDVVFAKTEQVQRLNASLQHLNKELGRRNRELQDFAYVASHDLQEPLRKIRAFAGLLQDEHGAALDESGAFYLERMTNAAGRMSDLLVDLLTFSRVMTRGQPFTSVRLDEIAAAVVEDLDLRIEETGARVEVGGLPEIEADGAQMRRLLYSLFDNALKFRHPERPPHVQVEAALATPDPDGPETPPMVVLTVTDNGIGFEEKYLDRIFTPFQRLHERHTYAGTGMGLTIARRIVERHNGSLAATSTPGAGSRFVVQLPVRQRTPPA